MRILVVIVLLTSSFLKAQEDKAVLIPIHLLFNGMENADTSMINRAFTKDAKMLTGFVDKSGAEVIKEGSLTEFLATIANKPKDGPKWKEKIYNTKVRLDGNIAQVWTDYSFFVGEKLIHCGVDAFQLIKVDGEWRIIHIMDTRRKERCKED